MIQRLFLGISVSLLFAGCHLSKSEPSPQTLAYLGSLEQCQKYSGLPENWQKDQHTGMVWIPTGEFELGSKLAYPDEVNFGAKTRKIAGFWMDQTEVTVAQFSTFVQATHYVTDAEKQKEAAVFSPDPLHPQQWWQLKSGYTWKTPYGEHGPQPKPAEPVRYVTQNDAEYYAVWLGRDLPNEAQWEYAAKANSKIDTPMHHEPKDTQHKPAANYWQGQFPFQNLNQDHFQGVAPVGCFTPNPFKLYDMIGNVWEWTTSPYTGAHDEHMGDYSHLRDQQIQAKNVVIKGGSFLCADNYCARFRASSRHPQEIDLATTHVGFRTIRRD